MKWEYKTVKPSVASFWGEVGMAVEKQTNLSINLVGKDGNLSQPLIYSDGHNLLEKAIWHPKEENRA